MFFLNNFLHEFWVITKIKKGSGTSFVALFLHDVSMEISYIEYSVN